MSETSVAEQWLPVVPHHFSFQFPLELIYRAAARCARETGWTVGESFASSEQPLVQGMIFESPDGRQQLQLRQHISIPMIGFVDQKRFAIGRDDSAVLMSIFNNRNLDKTSWGYPYLDTPISAWWASAGWLVPDAAWFNDAPGASEYALLSAEQHWVLKGWQGLSRGDAMFFTAFGVKSVHSGLSGANQTQ